MSDSEPIPADGSRRRRRSSAKAKAKPAPIGPLGWIRTPQFARGLFAVMALLAAAYVWQTWRSVRLASERLGPVALGMNADQVRTALGTAETIGGSAGELLFDQDGRKVSVILGGPAAQVVSISCREQVITAPACPAVLGIRVGDERAKVQRTLGLGQPFKAGQPEQFAYPQLGAVIDLRDGQVVAITLQAGSGRSALWQMVLRQLVP